MLGQVFQILGGPWEHDLHAPFVSTLVDGVQHGAAALDDIVEKLHVSQCLTTRQVQNSSAGKENHSLKRRRDFFRQEKIRRHPFVVVGGIEGNFFLAPVGGILYHAFHLGVQGRLVVRVERFIGAKNIVGDGLNLGEV